MATFYLFSINDVENGLLYSNFIVKDGVPKIKTRVGTGKDDLVTDLVDAGKFREVVEEVLRKLVKDGKVVLMGSRGIGKSTLATYVIWRLLREKSVDVVLRVKSLNPGDNLELSNEINSIGKKVIVVYDPSPIEAYYKPEAMQMIESNIENVSGTLNELMKIRNAWVIVVLPFEYYDLILHNDETRNVIDEIRNYIIDIELNDYEFLSEVMKKYSGCGDLSFELGKGIYELIKNTMGFYTYTLVAKYVGIWLRERGCKVEDVDKALRESVSKPKLFFANYIWGSILGKSMDLARRVSLALILRVALDSIPEEIIYITKAVNEGGVWKLIDRDRLAKANLEDLREDALEPIAKWLSILHEDLIEETLEELVGLRDEEARKHYIDHGFKDFIKALDWGYEKVLEELRALGYDVKPEKIKDNLLSFVEERKKKSLDLILEWKKQELINFLKKYNIDFKEEGNILMIKGDVEYIKIATPNEIIQAMNEKKKNENENEEDEEDIGYDSDSELLQRICIVQEEKKMHICFDVDREESGISISGPPDDRGIPITKGVSFPHCVGALYDRPYLKIFFC
jgi:hypothetical protein